jgi:site-specific DNA-methyltransferase (adenine-specific)
MTHTTRTEQESEMILNANEIITGDCRDLAKEIPDHSVDLIFTDPPYLKEYLPLYDWLFQEAVRLLKFDGFLMTYIGGFWKDHLMASARKHLEFFWDFTSWEKGNSPIIWPRRVISRCKSILCYRIVGSEAMPRMNVLGLWRSVEADKRFHVWGQEESAARYYIDCFSKPGDLVLDPFCGGGTTPAMSKILGRNYIAFENDWVTADVARARVASQQMPLIDMSSRQDELEVSA